MSANNIFITMSHSV